LVIILNRVIGVDFIVNLTPEQRPGRGEGVRLRTSTKRALQVQGTVTEGTLEEMICQE
jgi:hypothetical protein